MANLNDSADIFANSSTETVAENTMDFSSFLKQNEMKVKNCIYNNIRFPNKDFIHMNQPLSQSSPLGITSPTFSNSSMNVSFITNQFVTDACNASILLFCPFCPEEYKSEFLLKEHIKISHPHELKHIIRMQNEGVEFHACPFCHAKYYLKELLPKHIVKKHQECVLTMFPDVNPDKYAYCPFCSHKVLTRHSKLMIVHIEKKHFVEFQQAIHLKCKNTVLNSDDLKTLDYDRRNESGCSTISRKMRALTTSSTSLNEMPIKSILKKTTSYPDGLNESCGLNERHLSTFSLNNSSAMIRRSARRRLRFELPESPSSDSENKENSIFSSSKKQNFSNKKGIKLRWRNLFHRNKKNKEGEEEKKKKKEEKSKKLQTKIASFSPEKRICSPKTAGAGKKKVQTTPVYSSIGFKGQGVLELVSSQFKCGLCYESFNKNAQLLEHIRRSHKGLKLLPQYLCGHCDAKFYRNTFLVRHCWYHHTPHCLKTEAKDS